MPVLSVSRLDKWFHGQRALDSVDLDINSGEVHALVGQNGSGKSTLIKILAGYHQPDDGAPATFAGRPLDLSRPDRPSEMQFVHQDLGLINSLSVIDNLALGHSYAGRSWLSERRERANARTMLEQFDLAFDPRRTVAELSPAEQAMVALVRAVRSIRESRDGGLLVLDEVTAAFPGPEVTRLLTMVRQLRNDGTAVLYVTHRMQEIFEIADRVTVLRDGRKVTTTEVERLDHDTLVELMVGRSVEYFYPATPVPRKDAVLEVTEIRAPLVNGVSLTVHTGEIVGVAGLVGSGADQLLGLIYGAAPRFGGTVTVDGTEVKDASPSGSLRAGLTFAPAERKALGSIQDWTVRGNLTLPDIPSRGRFKWFSERTDRMEAKPWLAKLDVVPSEPDRQFSFLSGGNQQKVVLGRWLRWGAKVALLNEPTSGVDISAKQGIYRAIADAASSGTAFVLASSDSEELCAVCDRVIVIRNGELATILSGETLSVDRLTRECLASTSTSDNKETQS